MPAERCTHEHDNTEERDAKADGCSGAHEPKLSRSARLLILVEVVAVAVLAGHPLIARSTYNRAASFYALQMPEKAMTYCRKTLALAPDHADAWELIAYCQDMQKRPQDALRSFDIAINLDPALVTSYVESGLVMLREGRYREAIHRFRQTAALDPENLTAARFPVLCFSALGERERAIEECERVLAEFPNDAVTQRWLAKLKSGEMGSLRRQDAAPSTDTVGAGPLDVSGEGS